MGTHSREGVDEDGLIVSGADVELISAAYEPALDSVVSSLVENVERAGSRCTCTAVWRRARRAHRSRISTCLLSPGTAGRAQRLRMPPRTCRGVIATLPARSASRMQPWPGCLAMTSTASADAASSSITASRYTATISVSSCRAIGHQRRWRGRSTTTWPRPSPRHATGSTPPMTAVTSKRVYRTSPAR